MGCDPHRSPKEHSLIPAFVRPWALHHIGYVHASSEYSDKYTYEECSYICINSIMMKYLVARAKEGWIRFPRGACMSGKNWQCVLLLLCTTAVLLFVAATGVLYECVCSCLECGYAYSAGMAESSQRNKIHTELPSYYFRLGMCTHISERKTLRTGQHVHVHSNRNKVYSEVAWFMGPSWVLITTYCAVSPVIILIC